MRTFVAYPNLNVKFVGINAGLLGGGKRRSHPSVFMKIWGIVSSMPGFTNTDPRQMEIRLIMQ